MSSFDWALNHPTLNRVIISLEKAHLSQLKIQDQEFMSQFQYAGWLATYLANSKSHKHRQKALLFAALSKLVLPENMSVEAICYTIFARIGDLPAAMHLTHIVGEKQEYTGPSLGPLSDEFLVSYIESFSDIAGGIVLTEFQKNTSVSLANENCGVISAPTSAGKSFIIHEYVKSRLKVEHNFVALFIVPTKALIAQVSAIYRKFRAAEGLDFAIATSVVDEMEPPPGNAIFALTQERCIRFLSTYIPSTLTFVFADEIQSIGHGERGALLEYVIHELRAIAPDARYFAAGPFIAEGQNLGKSIFSQECPSINTMDSPVSQMVVQLAPVLKNKLIQVKVLDSSDQSRDFSFEMPVEKVLYSRWQGSQTKAIRDAVRIFAGSGPSIVYAPGQGTAQNWAREYIEDVEESKTLDSDVTDLITYIKESIHSKCSLVKCLSCRVAYHHAGLPDFVREEIEDLFAQHKIDVLFCTSTLLEGVNLPADKMFVVSAKKADEAMSAFDFKNLIGRAGRLNEHLCGIVYCVQVPNDDKPDWIETFREDTQKVVKPTVDERLASSFDKIRSILENGTPLLPEEDESELRGTVTILRSRFLRNPKHVAEYLASKNLSSEQQASLLSALEKSIPSLSIPGQLALRNPYVDPFLQDNLYKEVLANTEEWAIRPTLGFATDIENVFKKLDAIFHVIKEINPIGNPSYYRGDLLTFAKLWLRGKPFKEIVSRAMPSKIRQDASVDSKEVDKAIKKAMDFITKDISYVTAKYFSVLAEIVKAIIPEEQHSSYTMTVALPGMLELGCSDTKSLLLITACIPRAAAIKIAPLIPDEADDPVVWLSLNQKKSQLHQLPPIYHKILKRCGVWS